MALGFKVADGYVEVHADHDRGELKRAAQQAADRFGADFNARTRATFKKSGMAAAGQRLGKELVQGIGDGAEKEAPALARRIVTTHLTEVRRVNRRRRTDWRGIGREIGDYLKDGLAGQAGNAATAFFTRFAEFVTLGAAPLFRTKVTSDLGKIGSRLGSALGLGVAAGLILQLSNAIVAGLPLALGGAFAAIPFFTIIRSGLEKEKGKWKTLNNDVGRQLQQIINTWKVFKVEISKPWKPTVMATLAGLKGLMDDLETPLTRIGKAIAPAFGKLMQGVFDSIKAFVKAVEPAMPGIAEGLKTWGKELPRVATALGDFISEILKDPDQVHDSIVDFVDFIVAVVKDGAQVVTFLAGIAREYGKIADEIDKMESDPEGPFAGIGKAFTKAADDLDIKITERVKKWGEKLRDGLDPWIGPTGSLLPMFKDWAKKVGDVFEGMGKDNPKTVDGMSKKIVGFFGDMKDKTVAAAKKMWADIKASYNRDTLGIANTVKGWKDKIVGFFSDLKTRVVDWVKRMWSEASSSFKQRISELQLGVSRFRDNIVNTFTNLKTRVENTWKTFWANMKKKAVDTISSVNSFIGSTLDSMKRGFERGVTAIGKAWDKVRAAAKKPVRWIFDVVLNGGLIKAFNWVADKVAPSLHMNNFAIPEGFASGGVLPGYTPGRDVHRFHSATGGVLDLSGGEGIARPELVRQVGTDRWDKANAAAAHGRLTEAQGYLGGFALGSSGGFLGGQRPVPPGWTHQHSGYGWARWAGDLQASMNTAVKAWNSGTIASVRSLSGSYGRHIIENVGGQSVYYAHLARAIVRAGQKVNQGQLIGYSDSTGNSTGPHLHFEIRGGGTAIGGTAGGGGGGTSVDTKPSLSLISSVLDKLKSIKDTPWGRIVSAAATKIAGSVKDKIASLAASFIGPGPAGSGQAIANSTNKRIVQRAAAAYGWNTGGNWNSLVALINGESGFRNTAQNPTSSAYGMFQFLNSTWATVGGRKTSDPWLQSVYGLRYIDRSYGSPINAYSKWASRNPHWYDKGGILPKGLSLAYNGTGRDEQMAVLPNAALQHASATGQAHGRAFNPTINVTVQAGLNPVDAGARRALVKALWLELDRYEKDYVR